MYANASKMPNAKIVSISNYETRNISGNNVLQW